MDVGATIFSTGWASGVNSYATVLVLCLLGRAGIGDVPGDLDQDWVLLAAAGMFTVEFFTDKIPFLDSAWDSIHTVVRPLIGAVLVTVALTVRPLAAGFGLSFTLLELTACDTRATNGCDAEPVAVSPE